MSSPLKDITKTVEEVCTAYGCENYDLSHGGKHLKLTVYRGTNHRTISISATPSCSFVLWKVARNLKHALLELGFDLGHSAAN